MTDRDVTDTDVTDEPGDDPTDLGDHAEAEGVAIMAGTEELYRYMLEDGTPVPTFTLGIGVTAVAIVALEVEVRSHAHDRVPIVPLTDLDPCLCDAVQAEAPAQRRLPRVVGAAELLVHDRHALEIALDALGRDRSAGGQDTAG